MCSRTPSCQTILRLLEMILSAMALVLVIIRGSMVHPWGIWCEFVWVFCFLIPLIIWIAEALSVHILLKLFLPDWADLVCGLTMICTLMISSATVFYAAIFACYTCVLSIITVTASAAATLFFLLDAVLQKFKCPSGYLSRLRGALRFTEAFVACILLTAVSNHFLYVDSFYRPAGMMWGLFVVTVCLLANVVVILFNLVTLLRKLLPMHWLELLYNCVAMLLYLSATVLWLVYGYIFLPAETSPHYCTSCSLRDLHTVIGGMLLNLLLYILDLVVSIKAAR